MMIEKMKLNEANASRRSNGPGSCTHILCAGGVVGLAVLLLTGCGKKETATAPAGGAAATVAETPAQPADPVDLSQYEAAFASARPGLKMTADEAATAIRARNFRDAVEQLQRIAGFTTLTPGQRQAVQELINKVRAAGG